MDQDSPRNLPGNEPADGQPRIPTPSYFADAGTTIPSLSVDPTLPAPSYLAGEDVIPPAAKRRVRIRVAMTVGVVAIVIGVVAGVGLTGEHGTPVSNAKLLRLIHSAASAVNRSPGSTFTMTMTISGGGQQGTLMMDGISNTANRTTSITMTGLGINQAMRTVHGVSYVRLPAASIDTNAGKPWLAVRSLKPTPEEQQLAASGPAGYLTLLPTVGGTIYDEGTHTVSGVVTTEYSFHVNLLKLVGSQLTQALASGATPAELNSLGLDNIPMKLWLDQQGVPRELQLGFSTHGISINEVAYITPSYRVVHISAPPAAQVHTVGSLTRFETIIKSAISGEVDPSQLQGS